MLFSSNTWHDSLRGMLTFSSVIVNTANVGGNLFEFFYIEEISMSKFFLSDKRRLM